MEQTLHWPGWEIVRKIGTGGYGTVYEIQREFYGDTEKAALKVITIPHSDDEIDFLRYTGMDDASITQTFRQQVGDIAKEYKLMAQMRDNPNVVHCDDFRAIPHEDGLGSDIYIKMELLTPLMKCPDKVMSEAQIITLGKDICNALAECQQKNILHRDIKPQNIFVADSGQFKLGDFGIARTAEKTTQATAGIGTYSYMAPEVEKGQPYGKSADIYSLGLILYWLLNERRGPFFPLPPITPGPSDWEQARLRRFSGEPIPAPLNGSKELQNIVLKACAFDPKERYQTAQQMLDALNELQVSAVPPIIQTPKTETAPPPQDLEKTVGVFYQAPTPKETPAAPIETPPETQDPDKTVGVFWQPPAAAAPQQAAAADFQDPDKTVGPTFSPATRTTSPADQTKKQPDNKKKKLFIGGGIALAVLVIILLLLLRSCGPSQEPSTEPSAAPSTESSTAPPVPVDWSDWQDSLPNTVTADAYEIEEQTLYRSRNLETTSSESNTMEGWELYDTTSAGAGYGPWSSWSADKVSATDTRQVETQTMYRYRNKETTTGSSSTKSGWSLYDTTYAWSNYGSWSDWSTSAASASDSRQVETKTQYRYRTVTVTQEYTDWSSWSGWTTARESTSDFKKEESRTVWGYYYYLCPSCGAHMHVYTTCFTWAGGCGRSNIHNWNEIWSTTPWSSAGFQDWHGTGRQYTYINGQLVFKWTDSSSPKAQYRYATRSLQDVTNYGSWSGWSDAAVSATSSRQVETRTVYRYRDRSQVPTYHFERWGSWSGWSADAVSASDTRQVETTPYYRYRDQVITTTYWFRRWTDWSEYGAEALTPTETTEVETKTQYRYRPKQ